MSLLEAILLVLAGGAAGAINVVVGSGTLITFPLLLALGYSPLVANVSNTVGLVPASFVGAFGYRRELRANRSLVVRLAACTITGSAIGAALLLVLPEGAFDVIVPVLVALAVVLVAIQPWLSKQLSAPRDPAERRRARPPAYAGILGTGVYGGYFGAAQGVLTLGVLGLTVMPDIQEANGVKNLLTGLANLISAAIFIVLADIAWEAAGLLALGSAAGGVLGAGVARRLSRRTLRAVVVVVGLTALVQLLR